MRPGLVFSLPLLLAVPASAHEAVSPLDRLIHEQMIVLDTHLDTPMLFERPGWKFDEWHEYAWDQTQVDLPRMAAGGLDGGFFVVYTPQGELTPEGYASAREAALLRAMAIQRVMAANSDEIALATTAADAERLHEAGKRIAYQSIENSYPLGEDLSLLETFYKFGVRMAGPVHSKNNQFADSTTDTPRWNGLSPLGKEWVKEMNRLGIVIDGSHSSDAALEQLIELSATPVILSHSGPRALYDHSRNIPDDLMRKLAASGGVMQVNSLFLGAGDSDERSAIEDRQERWLELTPAERRQLVADKAALDARQRSNEADFDMYMKSLLHSIEVMGVDHVGLGADWDGGGGLPGIEDITALPRITAHLREAGYSDADIEKIWSGNVLRLLRQAEEHAQRMKQ
ncbi:dipeptidase [Allosphingosinicella sp.]|uniref:dipeptidase n=1 Tax=Allosphingosinicella sp. TaxID=2823234 RepID=UPI002FC1812F